jgi:proteasome lid subunit RPN8/RPN11
VIAHQSVVTFHDAFEAAKKHARAEYPRESCGVIVDGVYVPCDNTHADPETHFAIASDVYLRITTGRTVNFVVHSHPDGPLFPSALDMQTQIAMQVPWAIIALDEDRIAPPTVWGDPLEPQPIVGRQFMHGVTDCLSLIRDCYRLGKVELAKQGIIWPFDPLPFAECPRDDAWWDNGGDLYVNNFAKWGFKPTNDPKPGDVFFAAIGKSKILSHGGVLTGNDLICHHLPTKLSRREPAGIWGRAAAMWVRYAA